MEIAKLELVRLRRREFFAAMCRTAHVRRHYHFSSWLCQAEQKQCTLQAILEALLSDHVLQASDMWWMVGRIYNALVILLQAGDGMLPFLIDSKSGSHNLSGIELKRML